MKKVFFIFLTFSLQVTFAQSRDFYSQKIKELFFKENYTIMAEEAIRAIKDYPNDSEFYSSLGTAYIFLNMAEDAKLNFEKAMKADSKHANSYNGMGTYYLSKKEYKDSVPFFKKAIELDSTLYMAYHNLGYSYEMTGEYEKAIDCFKKALENEKNMRAYLSYNEMGLSYAYLGKYKDAIECFTKAISIGGKIDYILQNIKDVNAIMNKNIMKKTN